MWHERTGSLDTRPADRDVRCAIQPFRAAPYYGSASAARAYKRGPVAHTVARHQTGANMLCLGCPWRAVRTASWQSSQDDACRVDTTSCLCL